MPIRTKQETQYVLVCPPGHAGGSACSTISTIVDVPIRDWKINPPQLNKVWQMGTAAPGQLFQDFVFPELEFVYTYSNYRFKIKKNIASGSVDFVNLTSVKLVGDTFNQSNLNTERVFCDFQNLDNLSVGNHVQPITIEAYGIDSSNQEHFVESYYTEISVTVQAGTGISTDKNTYNLTFNKADGLLSGDDKIIVFVTDPVTVTATDPFINLTQDSVNSQRHLKFQNNTVIQNKAVGNYSGTVTIQIGSAVKTVTVNLQVINDNTIFYVNPSSVNTSLQKNLSETKQFSSNISNPNSLTIVVESKPSFIDTAVISNGVLNFTTVNSSTLSVGNYSGEILLRSGSVVKKVTVNISVVQAITHDFFGSNYYFAKDPNKVILNKTVSSSTYVKMTLKMFFNGYGEQYQEEEEYTFPYFKGSVEIFPGDEVQDFFIRASDITTSLDPVYQYSLSLVEMKFEEMNELDEVQSTFIIDNIYFAPGKKPKCFPIFSDYPIRGTYNQSIIKLNVDRLSEKDELNQLFAQYTLPKPVHTPKFNVDQFTFLRSSFKPELQKKIIASNEMQFIPLPEPERIIHIEWENQNLVFDWFSASGDVKIPVEIEHVLGESDDYLEEKFDSVAKKTLTVNTGWILKEEIDLITDLLKSRLCFVYAEGIRYKVYPISTKNELKDSGMNTFSMDIEFKILENED
ncbi:hypothetical protein [Chryseobacterium sp. ZHDP1]|uniref:hypothetical protein n=1 Tax=Chryseobacterium sp. ZHDP1 TaxID=2838877 RepID=UPI001BE0CA36|nr:hypothetical protein [Chryseobacterium sp. ZHDP1]QWA38893.1 hypothetical protein KKI44_01390 [Chryseobacterium sp. ZHDP1]